MHIRYVVADAHGLNARPVLRVRVPGYFPPPGGLTGAALAAIAHDLKSSSAHLGLMAFSALVNALERLGRAEDLQAAAREMENHETEYAAGIAALRAATGLAV